MIVKRGFKFRLKPTPAQLQKCCMFAGAKRWIFNHGLEQRMRIYEQTEKTLTYFEQNNALIALKNAPETNWLSEIHSQVLQQGLKDLDRAFVNFFRRVQTGEKPGFPRFKRRGVKDSFRYPQGVKVEDNKVFLPKIGWVSFKKTRDLQGEINETTITQEGENWYVSFSCEWEKSDPLPVSITEEKAVGIDLGVAQFATLACGTKNVLVTIPNPRILKRLLFKLRRLSRQLSRKAKGSKNRLKARLKLSKLHARIRNFRHNFVHQLSAQMIKSHDIFCIESLNITSMLEKGTRALARSIADASWGYFLHCLKYKAEEHGKYIVEAQKYFPSTQICSSCDSKQKLELSEREYHCKSCGLRICRDYNSAIVLKAAGMTVLTACGATTR